MPTLSVVIPAFNEHDRLGKTLQSVIAYLKGQTFSWEIIVVDDGSTDDTAEIARAFASSHPVHLIRYEENKGKGYALREGVKKATGEYVLTYDADSAVPMSERPPLLAAVRDEGADLAIGSRLHHPEANAIQMSTLRRFVGRFYFTLSSGLVPGIRDCSCGFKLFRRDVALDLFSAMKIDGFAHDVEILHLAILRKYRIREIPVRWTEMPGSKVRLLKHGWQMLRETIGVYRRKM